MMPVLQEFLGQSSAVGHNTRSQSSMLRSFKQFTKVWAECWLATDKCDFCCTGICKHLRHLECLLLGKPVLLWQVVKVSKAECAGVITPRPKVPVNAGRKCLKRGILGGPHGLEQRLRTKHTVQSLYFNLLLLTMIFAL